MIDKKLIMFDLDGTLTESKSPLSKDVAVSFVDLLGKKDVAVISGCAFKQFEEQFLKPLHQCNGYINCLGNLYLMPTSGSQLYEHAGVDAGFYRVYHNDLTLREKVAIYNAWESSTLEKDFKCEPWGEIAEDRGSQITFSMCGQEAPIEVKKKYDPDASIRLGIAHAMRAYLPSGFEIRIGGTTSIDVTRAGIDKAYGVTKIMQWLRIEKEDILFVGDALFAGGNDEAVKKMGVECVGVAGPTDTLDFIRRMLDDA